MRQLPPFSAIRAYEAAARHLNFKLAAEELCVTPSAISHQIRILEDYLATTLFIREHNRLTLTPTGMTYVGKLTTLLDTLDQSTREIVEEQHGTLRVLTTPGFAARWLVPRLGQLSFADDIRLRVSQGAPDTDFSTNDADLVIHWSDSAIPGAFVEPFMSSSRFPVASAQFIAEQNIRRPEDLPRVTLLHDEVMDGWEDWFKANNMDASSLPRGPRFAHCELTSTAAEQGLGVALAYQAIIEDSLQNGSLVRLFNIATRPAIIYSVAYQENRANESKIRSFRDWIFEQASDDTSLPSRYLSVVN